MFSNERRTFSLLLLIIAVVSVLLLNSEKWKNGNWRGVIASDGKGYYAYLPALFIYHDFTYSFAKEYENKYGQPGQGAYYAPINEGQPVNKYFAGVSLLMLPFFLLACVFSFLFGLPVDGYSVLFQCSISIAALFYFLAGLVFLRRTLRLFSISENSALFAVLFIGLGTNLYYYTVVEPSMSHVYSFFVFSFFIYSARKIFVSFSGRWMVWAAAAFALIILIRPSNGVVLLALPFLSTDYRNFKETFGKVLNEKKYLLISILSAALVLCIQPAVYYLQTGKWWVWSYLGESFNFSNPEMFNVLFSYRKGLFVYCPVLFISLFGLIRIFKLSFFRAAGFITFLFVTLWVISSWWSWWYGGSFGMRPFIEYFPFFGIALAYLIDDMKSKWAKMSLILVCFFFVYLALIQTWQAYRLILPWDGMNEQRYWKIFLKTDPKYCGIFTPDAFIPDENSTDEKIVFLNDLDPGYEWWDMNTVVSGFAHSGNNASLLRGNANKSVCFSKKVRDIVKDTSKKAFVRADLYVYLFSTESNAELVMSFERNGKSFNWNTFPLIKKVMEDQRWEKFTAGVSVPDSLLPDDLLTVYVSRSDTNSVYVDDLQVTFLITQK